MEASPQRSMFLRLPFEIRRSIIAPLLCQSEPLENQLHWICNGAEHQTDTCTGHSFLKFHFQLAILLTNRQLYEEGSDILYGDNTARVSVWSQSGLACSKCLGFDLLHDERPAAIRSRLSNWLISLEIDEEQSHDKVRDVVQEFCRTLQAIKRLRYLSVTLTMTFDTTVSRIIDEDEIESGDWDASPVTRRLQKRRAIQKACKEVLDEMALKVLTPFGVLRARQVEFNWEEPQTSTIKRLKLEVAEKLVALMTSQEPVLELPGKCTQLEDIAVNHDPGDRVSTGVLCDAYKAMKLKNFESFEFCNEAIVNIVGAPDK